MSDDNKLSLSGNSKELSTEIKVNEKQESAIIDSPTINVGAVRKELSSNAKTNNSQLDSNVSDYEAIKLKRHKKTIKFRVIMGIIAGVLGLFVGAAIFAYWYTQIYLLGSITYINIEGDYTFLDEHGNTINIENLVEDTENEIIEENYIHNFLLIGIDSRSSRYSSNGTGALSDVIMVMSVDSESGTIRMISIARDCYAYVPGYSNPMKINAAMSLGGPDVLKATIENHLRISIDGYAYINFYNMAGVIDAVGGVYVDLSSTELYAEGGLNHNLSEVNNLAGLPSDYQHVQSYGYGTWLNGRQAVAYARIRKIDSDYMRSQRQVEVLRSVLNQFMNMSVEGKARTVDQVLSLIATNIQPDEITNYAFEFLPSLNDVHIEYMQLPIEGCFNSGMYGSEWSIRPNWNAEIPFVQEFFYGRQTEFDPVREISSSPSTENCPTPDTLDIESLLR